MPYELSWEERGVVSRFWGVVTSEQLIDNNVDELLDPKFEHSEYDLTIFEDSVVFNVPSSKLRLIADSDANSSNRKPSFLVAIVAAQTVIHKLSDIYRYEHEVIGGRWKIENFATEAEARLWLAENLD